MCKSTYRMEVDMHIPEFFNTARGQCCASSTSSIKCAIGTWVANFHHSSRQRREVELYEPPSILVHYPGTNYETTVQFILRLLNTNVDGKQKIMYALTRIKGVGRRYSNLVCKKADVDLNKRYDCDMKKNGGARG